jgi:hypothetical protein
MLADILDKSHHVLQRDVAAAHRFGDVNWNSLPVGSSADCEAVSGASRSDSKAPAKGWPWMIGGLRRRPGRVALLDPFNAYLKVRTKYRAVMRLAD